jgi:hypothetical protein
MAVGFVQAWTWGPLTTSGGLQNHFTKVPFSGAPHIVGTAYLAEVSIGGQVNGAAGVALATFSAYETLDAQGAVVEVSVTSATSIIEVVNCVSITIALDIIDATAMGGWSFYWMD